MAGCTSAACNVTEAAQLMPPPRLPRHLRPCPPSVTARQVRCIHATGPARLWTSGRDAPQTPSAKSDNGDKSDSIDRPDTRRDAPGKKDPWWKQALGRISSIGAHDHESASLEPKSETSHYDKQLEHSVIHVQETSEVGNKGEQGIGTKSGPPSHAQRPRLLSHNGQNVETPGDTAALQAQVEARATPTLSPAALATEARDSDTLSKTQKLDLKPEPNRQRMNASRAKHLKRREARRLMSLAETYYLHSVGFLGNTATFLSRMDTPAVTPAVSSILRRFRSIYRISMLDDDVEVSWQCQKFKPTLDLLASKLRQPRVADHDLIDSLALKSIRTDNDVVNYSKTLLHGDVITRTVEACHSRYRGSTEKLLEIADVLQAFESPMVAPIASRVRQRLDAIAEQASREDDMLTLQSFTYYKKTRSVRKPWLSESVATLKRKGKNVEKRWTSYERQARNLRKELSTILPKVPEPSYGPTSKTLRRVEKGVARKKADLHPSKRMEDAVDVHSTGVPDRIESNDGQRLMNQIHSQSRSMTSSKDLTMDAKGPGHEMAGAERHSQSKNAASSNLVSEPSASTSASTAALKTGLPKQAGSVAMSEVSASTSSHTTGLSEQPVSSDELSEQSLLEELFPEVSSTQHQAAEKNKKQYPKLALPKSTPNVRPKSAERPPTFKQKVVESLQQQGEQITVLQLTNCSTELTEVDFRRIIPKGKHLEGWRRDSDFYKVIPGRDPLSLERLPFYYLLFKNTEAAISYQKNASRLHKLCALHQPSNILSAIPPPKGFLEDGEDIAAAVTSYNLLPRNHPMSLNILMQPYNPALRLLIQRGGYQPIAPSVDDKGKRIWRVLLHIEGWEPSPSDLFAAIAYDAFTQGILNPLRNESQSSLHRLRDVINLRTGTKLVSSSRPRAYGSFDHSGFWQATGGTTPVYDDPEIQNMMGSAEDEMSQGHMNQYVMNRVYNRWVLDFEDADSARRWSLRWHRRVFPDPGSAEATWRDHEEPRICNAEVLW